MALSVPPLHLTFATQASGANSVTITPPAPAPGNVLILLVGYGNAVSPYTVVPASADNWLKPPVASGVTWPLNAGSHYWSDMFYKVAGSAEPSSYVIDTTNTAYTCFALAEYPGVDTSTVFDTDCILSNSAAMSYAAVFPGITTVSADAMVGGLLSIQNGGGHTFTPPASLTDEGGAVDPVGINAIEYFDGIFASAGATGALNCNLNPNDGPYISGIMFALKPATGGTTYNETLTVAGAADTTPTTSLTANAAFGVAGAAGVAPSGQVDFSAAFTLIGAPALSMGTGVAHIYNEVFSVGASAGLSLDVAAQVAASFALAATANLTAAGNVFNASAVTPLARMYQVAMESRTLQVASEERRLVVNVENRSMKA